MRTRLRLLWLLRVHEPCKMSLLADKADIGLPKCCGVIARLRSEGLVSRNSRRLYRLTKSGREAVETSKRERQLFPG